MAIDSENKRRSTTAMGIVCLVILPVPDTDLSDDGDRPHVLGLYAGAGYPEERTRSNLGLFPDRFYDPGIYYDGIYHDAIFNILNYI